MASSEYEKLKESTGATDEELGKVITLLLNLPERDKIANLQAEVKAAKLRWAKNAVSSEEEAAMWTLLYLSQLEEKGGEVAADYMAKRLDFFLNSKGDSEARKKIRRNIRNYAAKSEAFRRFYQKQKDEGAH